MKLKFSLLVLVFCSTVFVSAAKSKKPRRPSKTVEPSEPSEPSEASETNDDIVDAAVVRMKHDMEVLLNPLCNACLSIISEIPLHPEFLRVLEEEAADRTIVERMIGESVSLLNYIAWVDYFGDKIPEDKYEIECSKFAYKKILSLVKKQNNNIASNTIPAMENVIDEIDRLEVLRRYAEYLIEGSGQEDLQCAKGSDTNQNEEVEEEDEDIVKPVEEDIDDAKKKNINSDKIEDNENE